MDNFLESAKFRAVELPVATQRRNALLVIEATTLDCDTHLVERSFVI